MSSRTTTSKDVNTLFNDEAAPLIPSEENHENSPPSVFEMFTALWFGLSSFIVFMMILATIAHCSINVFPHRNYGIIQPQSLSVGHLLANIVFVFIILDPPKTIFVANIGFCLISISFIIVISFLQGTPIGFYTALGLAFVQSWCLTTSLNAGFGLASVLHPKLPSILALGIAISGIVPLLVGPLLGGISPYVMSTALFTLSAIICALNFYLVPALLGLPRVSEKVTGLRRNLLREELESGVPKKQLSKLSVIRKALTILIATFLSTAVIFTLYPTLCAFSRPEPHFAPVIIGLHNAGELIGRSIVAAGFVLPTILLLPVALGRIIFVILFRLVYGLPLDHLLRSELVLYALQVTQGITFGHLSSSCATLAPSMFKTDEEKAAAGHFGAIAGSLGVPGGTAIFTLLVKVGYIPESLLSIQS